MAGGKLKLTARAAATTKPGRYGDGAGLYLVVSPSGARKWVFRFTFAGKVTETGLGSADVVSLAEVRDKAHEARKLLERGENPIEAKRQAATVETRKPTFGQCADALIAAKESEWRNEKHRNQWRMTLENYAAPLRSRPVDEIDTAAVLAVLTPLWQTRAETASRLRGRIEAVLDAAKARGHRSGENPAAWRGHLSHLLPKRGKLSRGHFEAMAYSDLPAFIGKLRHMESTVALALELLVLTATRSGEVRGATWNEFDLDAKVWTIPAERTKAGRQHRIPLAARAAEIIGKAAEAKTGELVFPGRRPDRPLSGTAMEMLLRRMKIEGATPHGFRSSFRDWAGNETHFARELAEAALAHSTGNAVEAAYRRSDALEKRRALMEAWADYCGSGGETCKNVIHIARKRG